MRTSWKKRLLVFAMLAAMLAAHAGSFAVLEVYPNHHHTGEHCVICQRVKLWLRFFVSAT